VGVARARAAVRTNIGIKIGRGTRGALVFVYILGEVDWEGYCAKRGERGANQDRVSQCVCGAVVGAGVACFELDEVEKENSRVGKPRLGEAFGLQGCSISSR